MNKRDANQGACTNACRWEYNIHEAAEDASGMSFQSNHWRQHQYVATIKMPTSNTPALMFRETKTAFEFNFK
jgi:collagenase-like PrtC family protease